jgi:hypothetical protein
MRWGYSTLPLRHRKYRGKYITGGPWNLEKVQVTCSGDSHKTYRWNEGLAYEGVYQLLNTTFWTGFDFSGRVTFSNAQQENDELGAEAWAKMKPAQPDFTAARELYELREIPQQLKEVVGAFRKKVRDTKPATSWASEWWLSLFFGWAPIFKSVVSFCETFRERKKLFDQLLRDEGQWKYRSRKLSNHDQNWLESDVRDFPTLIGHPNMYPKHVDQCYWPGAGQAHFASFERRSWCVGKFKYFLPSGPRDRNWEKRLYRRIFGLRLTPSQVYAVIPWSWFADYFTDLRYFMEAVSGGVEERLICDYAYVMTHYKWKADYTEYQMMVGANNSVDKVSSHSLWTREYKLRSKATVLGFGLKEGDLSPFQASIIGALGLSKLS